MLKIGDIQLNSDIVLAPLAGYTDIGFRSLAVKYGAGLTYTEMVSAKGLCYNNEKTADLLKTADNEKIKAVQIFGGEPEFMYKASKDERLAKFDIIDINMGCPVPKIVKNFEGSQLLQDIPRAKDIVSAVVDGSKKPVTVKFRKGFLQNEDIAVDFALAMEQAGASLITIHGRTREQFYSGTADWQCIKNAKQAVKIPVIANGDVTSLEDYQQIKDITKCDGVMIGRGAIGKPYIFAKLLQQNVDVNLYQDIKEHIAILLSALPERIVVNDMKKHICYYAKNLKESKKVKAQICEVKSLDNMLKIVKDKFDFNINIKDLV